MIFFSKSGTIALDSEGDIDWTLFGVPYDSTVSFNTGARFGPDSIREASYNVEVFDCDLEVDLTSIGVRDLGNINVRLGDPRANSDIVRKAASEVQSPFIALGGEHTIAYPLVSVVNPDIFISLDAHLDLRDEYLEEPLSHACTSRRIREICDIHIYGYRECSKEEYTFMKEESIPAYNPSQLESINYPEDKRVYLSLDMDVLDPSVAPNVSNPVPNGLQFHEVIQIAESIIKRNTLVGMDICEVCSRYADRTAVIAAYMLYKILAEWKVFHE
ncbi:MAG: agmatinase [Theionarchaea archaeon]|nr:agmatinase [Theionarchaea archaeon]